MTASRTLNWLAKGSKDPNKQVMQSSAQSRSQWGAIAPSTSQATLWLGLILMVTLAGCASRAPDPSARPLPADLPVTSPPTTPVAAPESRQQVLAEFERQHREIAADAARQGDWAAVEEALHVVLALRPKDPAVLAEMAGARQMAAAGAGQRLAAARAAQRRGEASKAQRHFLEALALSPENEEAAQGLRLLERERVQRQHLGQLSRNFFTRAPAAPVMASRGMSAGSGRSELEHATLLASQGETRGAIAVLQPLATSSKPDTAARLLLADLYVRHAEELMATDRFAAEQALQSSLQLEPRHAKAAGLLKAMRASSDSQQGTKSVPATPSAKNRR